ncbi:hypothetical protein [Pedobacter polysacchareus]|uniref:hypothetical protein n=1 Tax=Pedobacter polysacchareus TaxID=2861973 RepID=UPI001C99B78B|nr:hypothetical protein [Pedobacter polysacchareus]
MKTAFYSLMVIMFCSSATCRKAQSGSTLEHSLIGTWKYIGKSGGYAGKQEKADPSRKVILQFNNGFRYQQKINDKISDQGSYEIFKVKSIYSGKEDHAIRFRSTLTAPSRDHIISMRNDSLTLADNVYDGFQMEYIRATPK